jgi:hypothetical protein
MMMLSSRTLPHAVQVAVPLASSMSMLALPQLVQLFGALDMLQIACFARRVAE